MNSNIALLSYANLPVITDSNFHDKLNTITKGRQDGIPSDNIGIALIGGVSAGKSTGFNCMGGEDLSESNYDRTTTIPIVMIETTDQNLIDPISIVKQSIKITKSEKKIIEKRSRIIINDLNLLLYTSVLCNINSSPLYCICSIIYWCFSFKNF